MGCEGGAVGRVGLVGTARGGSARGVDDRLGLGGAMEDAKGSMEV
jgi:hypothetical protein